MASDVSHANVNSITYWANSNWEQGCLAKVRGQAIAGGPGQKLGVLCAPQLVTPALWVYRAHSTVCSY